MDEEQWIDIPHFSRYQVSNCGRIYNKPIDIFMSLSRRSPDGQYKISLIDDYGVRHSLSVAYLVAEAFVNRPNQYCTEVILLDGNFHNVNAHNLAWREPRVAYLYAKQMKNKPRNEYLKFPVRNCDTGVEYENIIQAGITEGLLFEEIWISTWQGYQVPPFGHVYEEF